MVKMKWMGMANLWFLLATIVAVFYMIQSKPLFLENRVEKIPVILESKKLPDIETSRGTMVPGVDLQEVATALPQHVVKGKKLFAATGCTACHGDDGKGDGIGGAALKPIPRNFHSLEGWTNGPQLFGIYKTLTQGVKGTGMSAYDNLPVADRFALAHYIRSLNPDYPATTPEELVALDTTFALSAGKMETDRISLAKLLKIMDDEAAEFEKGIENASRLAGIDRSSGAIIFRRLANDPSASLRVLFSEDAWKINSSALSALLTPDPGSMGLKSSLRLLSGSEWEELHSFLLVLAGS